MTVRMTFVVLVLLITCSVCRGEDQRWSNFAEDNDLKYYLDVKSVVPLPDNVYLFWVKTVAKDKEYFRTEYNVDDLSYVYTNYELDCAVSSFRVRGTILFDKHRREINKNIPALAETKFEPIPPESVLELAQSEICVSDEDETKTSDLDEQPASASAELPDSPQAPAEPLAPAAAPSIM
jgi:hypothetical protein